MKSSKMPLILDNPMGGEAMQVDLDDVDDLFGDGAPLTLPPRPISKRLRQRLDELRERGSYQGIAWSKAGTIASITPDGQHLQLMYIHAKGKDATFTLSDPTTIAPWESLTGGPLVHLSWSPASPELAIIDAVGRVLIISFSSNLNRPSPSRRWDGDSIDDLQAVVGTYWLPSHHTANPRSPPYTPSYGPAVRNGNGNNYSYQITPIFNNGPLHPQNNRSAFICITATGVLKMFWAQNNGKIEETTVELENVTLADDLITHAAVCSDRRSLMVGLATASKQLCVVQVAINWNSPKTEGAQSNPSNNQPLSPTLTKRHVAVTSWFQPGSGDLHSDASMQKITHIEMLPPVLLTAFNVPNKEWSPIVILTVRSLIPDPNVPYAQEVQSIIDRWELLTDHHQTLHSAFEQLGLRKNSAGSATPNGSRLKKLDSVVVNKVIIGVNLINFGKVLCFSYNDGSVEYRDRFTMAELYREHNLDRINSVFDAGFSQSGEPSCLQTAFSPTNFSFVQLCEDGKVKWHSINYTLADVESMTDAQVSALVAAFYISTAQAVTQGANFDDILAVARNFINRDSFAIEWVKTQVQQMKITIDYTEDTLHDSLIKNGILQVCLSIINYLGWRGDLQPRKGWGKLSLLALNLRNITVMMHLSNSQIPIHNKTTITPLDEPEAVSALAGCVKWSNDLLGWICDSLFCLFDDTEFMKHLKGPQLDKMTMYLHANNEIALHLVLCSTTRALLSALCRRILSLDSLSTKAISWYETREKSIANNPNAAADPRTAAHTALHAAYQNLRQCISSSLIKADEFDKLLTGLGAEIRTAYSTSLAIVGEQAAKSANKSQPQNSNPNAPRPDPAQEAIARARQHCELDMLVLQAPPSSFVPVVSKFFNQDLKEFRARSEVAKLYFADYSILELDDEPRSLAKRRASGVRVDLFKRVEISRSPRSGNGKSQFPWRKCARCGNVMEDLALVNHKPGFSFLLRQQSNCSCGGRMAILPTKNA